jgi:hypothetical protein
MGFLIPGSQVRVLPGVLTLYPLIADYGLMQIPSPFPRRAMTMRDPIYRVFLAIAFAAASAVGCAALAVEAESAPAEAAKSTPADSLDSLEWLLGEWTGMTDHAVVLVSAHWCDGGAFIEREVIVRAEGQPEMGGTQRIGWDPVKQRIKSWTFDSQGGTGEGYWRRETNDKGVVRWIVESDDVMADGAASSTTSVFTPQGADRFVWEVERASVNGEHLPKQQIEFVRAEQN